MDIVLRPGGEGDGDQRDGEEREGEAEEFHGRGWAEEEGVLKNTEAAGFS
jgi:hypothetical protein